MSRYTLRAVRLINFHNFVDETIEIRDGGHLFLLGDNGSGKTTVLDAVHLVLAGGELELNAAARLGGRREDGRTLQGVVLRYDPERGVRHRAGAIAYAALELVAVDGGRRITIGIGVEATTMEARVARWGFVVGLPLAEVALLDARDQPLDRDGLRLRLGAGHVHAPLAGYRKELARRLFGSDAQYDEAVRFWGMAKAYREIVAGARDFGALFERLLPSPDGAVFADILRTLRAIDDLEVALRDLDGQRGYCQALADRVRDVATAREAAARYRWLAWGRERDEAVAAGRAAAEEAADALAVAERQRLDGEAARVRAEAADELVRRATSGDTAGVLAAIREREGSRRARLVEIERARAVAAECRRAREQATARATRIGDELTRGAARLAAELRAARAEVVELPGELATVAALAGALDRLGNGRDGTGDAGDVRGALPDVAAAGVEIEAIRDGRERAVVEARLRVHAAAVTSEAGRLRLQALEVSAAAAPPLDAVAVARRALAGAGIDARPVYELLEPAPGADPAVLAAIEALAGDAVLGALIVGEAERARARALIGAAAPGVRIVVATCTAPLPAWCAAALEPSPASAVARAVLGAALIQPLSLGPVVAPDGGAVALRGLGHAVEHARPRLLGADARQRAHQARLAATRQALVVDDQAAAEADRALATAQVALDRARALARLLASSEAWLRAAGHDAEAATGRVALAHAADRDAEDRVAAHVATLAALDDELTALRARIDGLDTDALDRRLAGLSRQADDARAAWHACIAAGAEALARARQAEDRERAARARAAELAALTVEATRDLRSALVAVGAEPFTGDDAGLAHHVRVTLRGDSFRSLDTLRQRVADEERAADVAAAELDGDGSRGVRLLVHAARFGFAYDRGRNQVEDRRGQPLAGVLAELDHAIAEQRSVVNERTRTLMDALVMGELARHLQGQVHLLHETVRGINRVLRGLRFGASEYQFQIAPRADRAELLALIERLSIVDEDSRHRFRAWIDGRLDELRTTDAQVPALLDYRRWFDFKLRMSTTDAEGVELTHRLRQVGSGGEQGVPNYLLVLALAKLLFDAADAAVRPLLFDEAFYGIDAGRRDQLLRLATDLGLQLLIASPDQDGATPAVRAATTLFVVKDAAHDVHLAPYHYWHARPGDQPDLFAPAAAPCPPPDAATCGPTQPPTDTVLP